MRQWFPNIQPQQFFLYSALVLGIFYNLFTPPFQSPDEVNHFYRTWQVSQGQLLPLKENQRVGGHIPYAMNDFMAPYLFAAGNSAYKFDIKLISSTFHVKPNERDTEFKDFPNTGYYSALSYFPQAVAVFITRKAGCPAGVIYYAGRLVIYLVWMLGMYLVIRLIPIYKWLATFLILLPSHVYLANSFSADTVTNIISLLFIACVFRMAFTSIVMRRRQIICLLFFAAGLALAKLVYVGLLPLLLLIHANKYRNKTQYILTLILVFSVAFIFVSGWSAVISKYYIPHSAYNSNYVDAATIAGGTDMNAQKEYILSHPAYFPKVIFNSVFNPDQYYLKGYIGSFGVYLDVPMKNWPVIIAYLLIILMAITESRGTLRPLHKLVLLLAALCTFVLILLSQHLSWDPVGRGVVPFLQGRYLVPVMPLLFMLFNSDLGALSQQVVKWTGIISALLLNIYCLDLLFRRYIYLPPNETIAFNCDAENLTGGSYITDNEKITLKDFGNHTSVKHRSGIHSVFVEAPEYQFCFTKTFENFHSGDLIEIEAWQLGTQGQLVVSGLGGQCDQVYFASSWVTFAHRDGWNLLHFLYQVPEGCDQGNVSVMVYNPTGNRVYFDDLRVKIRKFNKD